MLWTIWWSKHKKIKEELKVSEYPLIKVLLCALFSSSLIHQIWISMNLYLFWYNCLLLPQYQLFYTKKINFLICSNRIVTLGASVFIKRRSQMFYKISTFKIHFAKFTEKYLCWSLFFAGLRAWILRKF